VKKSGRNAKTGNPAKKRARGPAPEDRESGWLRWLAREHRAFWGMSRRTQEFVLLLALIVLGAGVWVWRTLAG